MEAVCSFVLATFATMAYNVISSHHKAQSPLVRGGKKKNAVMGAH